MQEMGNVQIQRGVQVRELQDPLSLIYFPLIVLFITFLACPFSKELRAAGPINNSVI